jgi:subtilisin family serine protease
MQGQLFGDDKISGTGVQVGVIDAGYYKASTDPFLMHIFNEGRIKAQRDFIDAQRKDLVDDAATDSDYHGRIVLDMICGYDQVKKTQTGMGVNADIYLARTENGAREYRGEEDNWVRALEWMDSMGVRLINTSLGYAIKMDDPNDNYKQEDMNGKTTTITKAAQIGVDEKGIFLVVSAGNEGDNDEWRIISAPADARGVLSVGATRDKVWDRIGYSSLGPDFLPYMKPNVSCYSPNGTSFSAPAGLYDAEESRSYQ